MSLYNYVQSTIEGLRIGDIVTIPIPDKLGAFRKFLSEISSKDSKKFTTKKKNDELHILRINYHSIPNKLENNV